MLRKSIEWWTGQGEAGLHGPCRCGSKLSFKGAPANSSKRPQLKGATGTCSMRPQTGSGKNPRMHSCTVGSRNSYTFG
ncbi:hypothetical protein GN956_G25929 [Arapaima gigas]